jgi:hypothetical protein
VWRHLYSVFSNKGKEGVREVPTLLGLSGSELILAESFLQYNKIECSDEFTITVSPAHELILFAMAGIPPTLMAQWKTEEQLATFYVVRQAILSCMETFGNDVASRKDCDMERCLHYLDESLENVSIYRLEKEVKTNTQETTFRYVPTADVPTIMMNGDGSPLADIIAPYTLIQAWRAAKPFPVQVDLYGELRKYGLLKEDCDTGVLQGLLALWQLSPEMWGNMIWRPETNPDERVSLVPPNNPIRYTVKEGEPGVEITVRNEDNMLKVDLSSLSGRTVTFVLSTDADVVDLRLGVCLPSFSISKANLDENMEVNERTLSVADRAQWRRFVSENILNGVNTKFLFTMTSEHDDSNDL